MEQVKSMGCQYDVVPAVEESSRIKGLSSIYTVEWVARKFGLLRGCPKWRTVHGVLVSQAQPPENHQMPVCAAAKQCIYA